jgi:hypothetical protein
MSHYPEDKRPIRLATCQDLDEIEANGMDEGDQITLAVVGYVTEVREFSYVKEGQTKSACDVTLDVEGKRFSFVKWTNKKNPKLPEIFKTDFAGAIVLAILNKFDPKRPFALDDLIIVQKALETKKTEAESDDD